MRIAVAGLYHETNTFAPGLTTLADFHSEWVHGNDAFIHRYTSTRTSMGGVIDALQSNNVELHAGLYASATPSGMVTKEAAATLIDTIVSSIDYSVDGIVVILHGAMAAEQLPDMEGIILQRIREKTGTTKPIAITLDLHANISEQMVNLADIIVGYDTYPHIDAYERAVEATGLLISTLRGEIAPASILAQPRMLIVPQVMLTDEDGPMRTIMNRAFTIERQPNVLNVTIAGGFPYGDVPDAGVAIVVTTNGDLKLAEQYAEELKELFWSLRRELSYTHVTAKEAVASAMTLPEGPIILVEGSDNVGGGAPADATHLLRHLINPPRSSLIVIRDKTAVGQAHLLGVGAKFDEEVGGKSDTLHGEPVRVTGNVHLLSDGQYTHIGPYMTGQWADMGKTAVIQAGNLTLILTEKRTAPWDPGHVNSVGVRPEDFHVIVVKSAIAWKTAFGSISRDSIAVDTPGCCSANLTHFTYKQIKRPIFPLIL